jgi:hypothetical protein
MVRVHCLGLELRLMLLLLLLLMLLLKHLLVLLQLLLLEVLLLSLMFLVIRLWLSHGSPPSCLRHSLSSSIRHAFFCRPVDLLGLTSQGRH